MSDPAALLEVRDLHKRFPVGDGWLVGSRSFVHAVSGVSFSIRPGETLSLVGESGCGKSTVGRVILGLTEPSAGTIEFAGQRIDNLSGGAMWPLRRRLQAVFQDPFSSLNPRMRVRDILAEPLNNYRLVAGRPALDARIAELLDQVRLPADTGERFPHEFSGGQRQRIAIARALATRPDLIVCDEAVSALDVSVKAQIVNLLGDLQRDLGLALLFISHDLAIVEHLTHRVAVMYLGKIVELAECMPLFAAPRHPYTRALLSAVPDPDPDATRARIVLTGDVPSPIHPPGGCRFHTRCAHAAERCRSDEPLLRPAGDGTHIAACHFDRFE